MQGKKTRVGHPDQLAVRRGEGWRGADLGATLLQQEMTERLLPARPAAASGERLRAGAGRATIAAIFVDALGPIITLEFARAILDVRAIRSTLAVYFVFAYSVLAVAFSLLARLAPVNRRLLPG